MNGVLGAGADAMFFAAAVFRPGKDGYQVLGFEAGWATGRDAETASGAGVF